MADSESLSPVPVGDLIAGKYRVGAVIAAGGMGVVVEGRHEALDQRVAIKFLLADSAQSPGARERFVREAQAAAKIESEHVVRVFDVGVHEGDIAYMVMEFLEGIDLAHEMNTRGPLPVSEAVDRVLQALEAIAEAHQRGIVHRDLKPSNLFLANRTDKSKRRRVKVLDFGISKVAAEARLNASLTSTRSLLGSPGYMSPEQVRNTKGVDARTDVWSIGVILFELLTGKEAYQGESLGDVFAKIREEPLPPVSTIRPDVPAGLEAVIARCLERDRERRYADGAALHEALLPYSSGAARGTLDSVRHAPAPPGAHALRDEKPTVNVHLESRQEPNTMVATSAKTSTTSIAGIRPIASRRVAMIAGAVGVMAIGAIIWEARRSAPAPLAPSEMVARSTSPDRAPATPAAAVVPGSAEPVAPAAPAETPLASPEASHVATTATGTPPAGARPASSPKIVHAAPAASAARPAAPASPPPTPAKKSNDLGI